MKAYRNFSGPSEISISSVSYEELIRGIDLREAKLKDSQSRWDFYVAETTRIRPSDYSRRMAIAECAIRAIGIVKKGKRSATGDESTLTSFAKSCGIDRRTLGDWVKAKARIFDVISSAEREVFQVSDAVAAVEQGLKKNPKATDVDLVQLYKHFRNTPGLRRRRFRVLEYLRAAKTNLTKVEAGAITAEEIHNYRKLCADILDRLDRLDRQRRTPRRRLRAA